MKRSFFMLFLFVVGSLVRTEGQTTSREKPVYVSVLQLVTTPEQFDGKLISVIGFLTMDREGDYLFAHQEDAVHVIINNAIQIEGTKEMLAEQGKLNQEYVKVLGTFHLGERERVPFYSGSITGVRSCSFWSDPQHPMSRVRKDRTGTRPE